MIRCPHKEASWLHFRDQAAGAADRGTLAEGGERMDLIGLIGGILVEAGNIVEALDGIINR